MSDEVDIETARKVVKFLNDALEADRVAVGGLLCCSIPCNHEMADHPTIQVRAQNGGFYVGVLGLLNGLCGIHEDGMGPICAKFEEQNENSPKFASLVGFALTSDLE